MALDLKHPAGRDAFLSMVERADVVVESYRPRVMDRLGIGCDVLHKRNPNLIYASISGYGGNGPYSQLPGHDLNYCALAGILQPDPQIEPRPSPVQTVDVLGGLLAAIRIFAAYFSRGSVRTGQVIQISLYGSALWLLPVLMATCKGGFLCGSYGCYKLYEAAEGSWVAVAALEPKFWMLICQRLHCEHLIDLQFLPDKQQLVIDTLARAFCKNPSDYWFQHLGDACVTPVRSGGEVADDPHVRAAQALSCTPANSFTNILQRFFCAPAHWPRQTVTLGEHTVEALQWAGLSHLEVDNLLRRKVVNGGEANSGPS